MDYILTSWSNLFKVCFIAAPLLESIALTAMLSSNGAINRKKVANKRISANGQEGSMLQKSRDVLDAFYLKYNIMVANLLENDQFLWQLNKTL